MNIIIDEILYKNYFEKHRHYHNFSHIGEMIKTYLSLREQKLLHCKDEFVQIQAILWHDAIYNPKLVSNEEKSINLMRSRLNISKEYKDRIAKIILDTKEHRPSSKESEIILDLDLMYLSHYWPEYSDAVANIRREYSHLSDSEWSFGRRKWISSFLNRDKIYSTGLVGSEIRARENLNKELKLSHSRLVI